MIEKVKKISNPLTVIAIFAAIAEISGTVILPTLSDSVQPLFVWFLIGFPTLLVVCFFITLNLNPRSLYSPSDYKYENNYVKIMSGAKVPKFENKSTEATKDNFRDVKGNINLTKTKDKKKNRDEVIVNNVNAFFNKLLELFYAFFDSKILESIRIEAQSKEFFVLEFNINKEYYKTDKIQNLYFVIINIFIDNNDRLKFIAIGKDIIDNNYVFFAEDVFEYMKSFFEEP